MGCTNSTQQPPPQKLTAQNRGRNRSRYSDRDNTPSRARLSPPGPIKREDAFNYGQGTPGSLVAPSSSSRSHIEEPTRLKAGAGTAPSNHPRNPLLPPLGYVRSLKTRKAWTYFASRGPDCSVGSYHRVAGTGYTSGLPPAWDRVANRVAERGPDGGLTKESVQKSLAANLKNEEWMKANVGSFLNAGKRR